MRHLNLYEVVFHLNELVCLLNLNLQRLYFHLTYFLVKMAVVTKEQAWFPPRDRSVER